MHRTYSYDNAIYLAEAGVEKGIAMLNYGANNWAANGWSNLGGATNYTKTTAGFTSVGDGSVVALGSDTVTISGSAAMYCTVYAPNSAVTISGSGSLIGAIGGNTFSLSGGMHVHYDEALRGGSGGQYAVVSWQEL